MPEELRACPRVRNASRRRLRLVSEMTLLVDRRRLFASSLKSRYPFLVVYSIDPADIAKSTRSTLLKTPPERTIRSSLSLRRRSARKRSRRGGEGFSLCYQTNPYKRPPFGVGTGASLDLAPANQIRLQMGDRWPVLDPVADPCTFGVQG